MTPAASETNKVLTSTFESIHWDIHETYLDKLASVILLKQMMVFFKLELVGMFQ